MKKIFLIVVTISILLSSFCQYSMAVSTGHISEGKISIEYRNVTVFAPAVAQTETGYVGVISTITVTIQNNGSGHVFVDTLPLTQIDMQGSARLAVKVASALVKNDNRTNIDPSKYDFYFVVRTSSPVIGGPSAGGMMTVAVVALLEKWELNNKTVMTGMINPDGSIGPIGGIPYKIDAAHSVGATRFLIPKGQMTYTEMVTETVSNNGWTQITTHPVTRNVSEYAKENYGMEVRELTDINDALLYFTGWNFPVVESSNRITTEDYVSSMRPLATSLLNESRAAYQNASKSFNTTEIPNRWPNYYKNQVTDYLNDAGDRLFESNDWYEREVYYTSTSKSFQSLINSYFVSYACNYFSSDDKEAYVRTLLEEADKLYADSSNLAKNAEISGMISLQCVGAAQNRVFEAYSYLADAKLSYNNSDYLTALYEIAYANQRCNSVGWWLGISEHYNITHEINASAISNLASEYIGDAQEAIAYANVLLEEMGKPSNYMSDAELALSDAQDYNEKGYSSAALFGALESLARANLAIELIDGVTQDKVDRARESASASITESRNLGIEPVLAVSYYEYGQSLENESSLETAIFYYKDSNLIAGALRFADTSGGGKQTSRYLGIPEITISPMSVWMPQIAGFTIFFAIAAGVGGLGLGLIIGSILSKREKEEYGQWAPRSIEDYYKKNK